MDAILRPTTPAQKPDLAPNLKHWNDGDDAVLRPLPDIHRPFPDDGTRPLKPLTPPEGQFPPSCDGPRHVPKPDRNERHPDCDGADLKRPFEGRISDATAGLTEIIPRDASS